MDDIDKVIAKLVDGDPDDYEHYVDDLHLRDVADKLWESFKSVVSYLDPDDFDRESTIHWVAIHHQDVYWNIFRGYTLTVIRIKAKEENPNHPLFK